MATFNELLAEAYKDMEGAISDALSHARLASSYMEFVTESSGTQRLVPMTVEEESLILFATYQTEEAIKAVFDAFNAGLAKAKNEASL